MPNGGFLIREPEDHCDSRAEPRILVVSFDNRDDAVETVGYLHEEFAFRRVKG